MSLPRISIKSLMAFVVLVGVGLAALAKPNNGWATVLSAFFLATLPTSLLGVIFRRGPARVGWVGFAVFGWSFFVLLYCSIGIANPHLVAGSAPLVGFDFRWSLLRLQQALFAVASLDGKEVDGLLEIFGKQDWESQSRVALSLMGLTLALLGGWLARAFGRPEAPPA